MNQNYQIGDYLNLDGDVYPYRVIEVSNPTPFYGETYVMIENGCDDGLSPIKITPETLEAFGFKLEYFGGMWFAKLKFDDGTVVYLSKKSREWVFCNNEPFEIPKSIYSMCVPVRNIHEIQHCMRVANIEKELEYNKK